MIIKVALSPQSKLGQLYYKQLLALYNELFFAMKTLIKDISNRNAYRAFGALESLWGPGESVALAIDEATGELVGFLHFSYSKSGDRFLYIHNFYVVPSERGKGTGRALMQWVQEYGRKKGCQWAELHVVDSNVGAQRLYQSFGFKTESQTMTLEL